MPAGEEVTVPAPEPSLATASAKDVSVTVIVKTSESVNPPSSATVTVTVLTPASAKPGVPVICAVPSPLSIRVAQPGRPVCEKTSVSPFGSRADGFSDAIGEPSATVRLGILPSTGGSLTEPVSSIRSFLPLL